MWTRRALCLAAVVSLSSCGDPNPTPDAGELPDAVAQDAPPDAAPECSVNLDCDDAINCNGLETCQAGRCVRGMPLRCDDGIACTNDFCSEELRACVNRPADADHDGHPDATCMDSRGMPFGDDCDDMQATIYPGALEVCDPMGRDEDCDPATHGGLDFDGDGYEDARCCNGTGAGACGTDCNDAVAGAHPTATEVCNGIDDNCDGMRDEGVLSMGFVDHDGDGRGGTMMMMGCGNQSGFSLYGDDCDDNSTLRSPLLPEICDLIDNDCDGIPDPADSAMAAVWYLDSDGDGFGDRTRTTLSCAVPSGSYVLLATDCDDTRAAVHPGQAEQCNGIDDDCNGSADYALAPGDLEDDDRDGLPDARCTPTPATPDCDDRDPSSVPGGSESCDGRDNDCDGRVDESVTTNVYYIDRDGDGYGSLDAAPMTGCLPIGGYVTRAGDCDDASAERRPGADERCNGRDEDCDLTIDEAPAAALCSASSGMMQICSSSGMCVVPGCPDGYADCVAGVALDCETSITTSVANCGGCGRACPSEPNASPLCRGGSCGFSPCASGFRDCNMNLGMGGDGCEVSVLTDPNNCGACGNTCAVAPHRSATCAMGVCGMTSTCDVGYGDCNAVAADGCEADMRSDTRNCGACGNNCLRRPGTVATCTVGTCSAPTCAAGFTDCNGDLASPTGDGCENPSAMCPRVTWHSIWGTAGDDSSNALTDIVVDAAGNIYAMYFTGSVINGPGDVPYTAGRFGSLIVSFSASGTHRWTQRFGTASGMTGDFTARRIAIHPTSGDLIVAGAGWGSPGWVGFGYPGAVNVGTQAGNASPFVVRLNAATGAYVWGQTFPMLTGPANGQCDGMTTVGDNIYITGRFDASFTIGGTTLTSAGLSDVYVARLNGSGVVQNAFRFGSNAANEWSSAIAIASNGDVLIGGGYDSGTADIGGRLLVNLGSADGFYARFPALGGASISAARITSAGASDYQEVLDIRAGTRGLWYISGRYDTQALIGAETLAGATTAPFLAAVRDADGTIAWANGATAGNGSYVGMRRFLVGPSEEIRGLFNAGFTPTSRFGGVTLTPGPLGPLMNGPFGPQIAYVNGATGVVNRIESIMTSGSFTSSSLAIAADGHNVLGGFTGGGNAGPTAFTTRVNDQILVMTGF